MVTTISIDPVTVKIPIKASTGIAHAGAPNIAAQIAGIDPTTTVKALFHGTKSNTLNAVLAAAILDHTLPAIAR